MTQCKQRGFSLIELIIVIIVLAIVGVGTTSFVRFGFEVYQDTAGRDRQISDSRFLIERLTRELRSALPNSVRVSNDGKCVEFMPIVASSSYVDIPVAPEAASDQVTVVNSQITATWPSPKIIVYPLRAADIYSSSSGTSGKIFDIKSIPTSTDNVITLTLENSVRFLKESPTERYFIVEEPVSYCQVNNERVMRYQGYSPAVAQPVPPSVTGVLMAKGQSNVTPFTLLDATLVRNAVVQLNFEFSYEDEVLELYNEVHVVNVP
ncbi:prepilin-type N-terminal cleavage/methylation domain-containing protein [Psychrobium sp. 1_MG-2023]|uniref:prepilin-type N-terminal cleavage/methylation domain-containing protein n=1 Tax=Psychrobium sp. 1_MG-2023 TaxID=3062624 RepID=UPI000C32EE0E|nr:prepilin-type N-terminal cleavage/methylation domain-containing protein [Psychrobium sp. 1_MG-2023]MDP2560724.1 prepilin-type N-terminal cleavage/methylation domain-containing protein [Psychrobium sp. 1_MG-2023]PKF56616.1 MSHA biogenesis protein MshO [Alteromonadales bacterium alter-6D02]